MLVIEHIVPIGSFALLVLVEWRAPERDEPCRRRSKPYVGDQPGPYAPYFLFFLVAWAPLARAAWLVRRFRLRADARAARAG
jgi:hypothetical protein